VVDDFIEECKEYFSIKHPSLVHREDFQKTFERHLHSLEQDIPFGSGDGGSISPG
jgi:hypothetical protein